MIPCNAPFRKRNHLMASRCIDRHGSVLLASRVMIACVGGALVFCADPGEAAADESVVGAAIQTATIDFARDIQPILASKCIRCHGPETHEAGLRLDDRKVAAGELESGNIAI